MTKILYSLKSIHKIIKENKPSKVCIVTSEKLANKLAWAIKEIRIPKSNIILLPDGEKAKEWKELEKLLKKFSTLNLDRGGLVITLGGGTVGDVTGFAASIYLRGIKYIQIPTTLLAQVDSSHGGKVGIDFLKYKNQIGSFYLPLAIVIDTRFIKSLSQEQIIDGLGEIIKAGLIKDRSILSLFGKHTLSSLTKSFDLEKIIRKSINVKNYFTAKDFKDGGSRQILNAGHTLGHAIELKYKISHGRAVIIGIIQELKFAESLKITPMSIRKNLENLLARLGIKIDTDMKADWGTVIHDKKIIDNNIDFPIMEKEGKAKLVKLDLKVLKSVILQCHKRRDTMKSRK
jgi:3-dehydroquinate synthase